MGFSLIEGLIALLLTGIVLSALSTITSHWLQNWNRGLSRVQRDEMLSTGLDRLIDDLGAAQFIPAGRKSKAPLFRGTSSEMIFVRTALGPNSAQGLDIVSVKESETQNGFQLVRSATKFAPIATEDISVDKTEFRDPVALVRAPFRVSFSYADQDGAWRPSWPDSNKLPSAVQLVLSNTSSDVDITTVVKIHVDTPASIVCRSSCEGIGTAGWDPRRLGDPKLGLGDNDLQDRTQR